MICYIVNPSAGSGKAEAAVPIVERLTREYGAEYSVVYTKSPGDLKNVESQIDLHKIKTIACVGGDGTVQEYIPLAVNREFNFAVIPAGSANDLLYSIPGGARKFRSFKDKIEFYVEKIFEGKTIRADVIAVNDDNYFLNIGGTGLDIQVLKDALPLKKVFGGGAYFLSLIKNAVTYSAQEMTLTVDGNAQTMKLLLLAVANGAYYGGKLCIAPSALIDDGFITLCTAKKMPRLKLMALFPLVKPGRHTLLKEVEIINCENVRLEYNGKKTINFDGNLYEFESPLTFKIIKN
jgi:YegS/Rv2252/BmrU family lipid kinase